MSLRAYRQVLARRSGLPGVALLAAMIALLGVAGYCSGHSAANGIVYGTVFGSGGPNPAVANKQIRMKDVAVTAARADSSTKFQTVTSNHGTYSLSVPPGTYVLRSECGKARPPAVRVPSGAKIKRNIDCEFG